MPELDEVRRIGGLADDRDDLVLTAVTRGRWTLVLKHLVAKILSIAIRSPPGGVVNVRHGPAGQRLSTAHLDADRRRLPVRRIMLSRFAPTITRREARRDPDESEYVGHWAQDKERGGRTDA